MTSADLQPIKAITQVSADKILTFVTSVPVLPFLLNIKNADVKK